MTAYTAAELHCDHPAGCAELYNCGDKRITTTREHAQRNGWTCRDEPSTVVGRLWARRDYCEKHTPAPLTPG